ncbi:MAG: hypothetical protein B7Z55_02095 [Planctomycetales bacterium 12-60-4]|nr:MAG: hypothetical protein B7Z55_02095 [Planctomycetales bacterium 12-60-4]
MLKLSDSDLEAVLTQRTCVISENNRLGSMGPPVKLEIDGQPVFVCCEGCRDTALKQPGETLKAAQRLRQQGKDSR